MEVRCPFSGCCSEMMSGKPSLLISRIAMSLDSIPRISGNVRRVIRLFVSASYASKDIPPSVSVAIRFLFALGKKLAGRISVFHQVDTWHLGKCHCFAGLKPACRAARGCGKALSLQYCYHQLIHSLATCMVRERLFEACIWVKSIRCCR